MARLEKRYFGELKGKFGDAVFKKLGDNNYVARRPKYTKPDTEEFKVRTNAFKFSCKLASLINANSYLKSVWRSRLGKNVQIHPRLISVNYNAFKNGTVIGNIQLVPDGGFGIKFDSMILDENQLSLKIEPLTTNSSIDASVDKSIRAVTFIIMTSPVDPSHIPVRIIQLNSAPVQVSLEDELTFDHQVFTADNELLNGYQVKLFFSTLITFDESNHISRYSNTFIPML